MAGEHGQYWYFSDSEVTAVPVMPFNRGLWETTLDSQGAGSGDIWGAIYHGYRLTAP